MDGLMLYAVCSELTGLLAGSRVDKVMMPTRDEVHLFLRSHAGTKKLVININSSDCRMHVSTYGYVYPKTPFAVCMYLRKHLTGAILSDITMRGLERVAILSFTARDEMGVRRELRMMAELMGKHSNLIITGEDGAILECFRHISISDTAVRPMLPGLPYTFPATDKRDPFTVNEDELAALLSAPSARSVPGRLAAALQGLSERTARELICAVAPGFDSASVTEAQAAVLAQKLTEFYRHFEHGEYTARLQNGVCSVLPAAGCNTAEYPGVSEMLDACWRDKLAAGDIATRRRALTHTLKRCIDKREKKLAIQLQTLREAQDADVWRKYADVLTANLYQLTRHEKSVTLPDYYNDLQPVTIPLDERYSPAVNAQRYFKKYNKLKKAAELNSVYAAQTEAELEFLRELEYSANAATTVAELTELAADVAGYGYGEKPTAKRDKRADSEPLPPLRYVSSEGLEILVGRNSRQNDKLTLHIAAPGDLWLHAKGPGSHVILRLDCDDIPDVSLLEAAAIAVYHSAQRGTDKGEVDYTFRRNIKKPSGGKPGKVIYDTYYSITVPVDDALVRRLFDAGSQPC